MGTQYRLSFNAGEITPELAWRNDLAKFQNGCRELSNFLVTPYGAARRRPSTVAMRTLSGLATGYATRLFSWASVNTARYAVIVGAFDVAAVLDDNGAVVTAARVEARLFVVDDDLEPGESVAATAVFALDNTTGKVCPWPVASLDLIQVAQVNDVMFFTHPAVPPMRLEHRSTGWVFKAHECFGGPFLNGEEESRTCSLRYAHNGAVIANYNQNKRYAIGDYCYDGTGTRRVLYRAVAASSSVAHKHTSDGDYWVRSTFDLALAGNSLALTFSGDVFTGTLADWNGTPWAVLLNNSDGAITENWITPPVDGANAATGTQAEAGTVTSAMMATGAVQLTTSGNWGGEIALEESTDGGLTWNELGVIVSNANAPANGSIEREITAKSSLVRVKLKSRECAVRDWMRAWDKSELISPNDDHGNNLGPWDTGCAITLKRIGEVWIYGTIQNVTTARAATFVPAGKQTVTDEVVNSPRWSEGLFSPRNGYPTALTVFQERLFFGGNVRRPQSVWGSAINDWTDFRLGTLDTAAIQFTLAADRLHAIRWMKAGKALLIGTDSGEWSMSEMNKQEALTGSNVQVTRFTEYGSASIAACAMADVVVFVQRNGQRLRSMLYDYQTDGFIAPDLSMLGKHLLTGGVKQLAFQRHPDPILWLLLADGTLASFTYDRDNDVLGWARHAIMGPSSKKCAVLGLVAQPGATDDEVWLLAREAGGAVRLCAMRPTFNDQGREQHLDLASLVTGAEEWDGFDFVSELEPTGMAAPDGQHGKKSRIAGVRLFVMGSSGGEVSADGGRCWEMMRVQGAEVAFDVPAVTGQQRLAANSGWGESVNVRVRSVGDHALTVCALGVEIERGE